MENWQPRADLQALKNESPMLSGSKEIQAFTKIAWAKIKEMIREEGFPAIRLCDEKSSKYIAEKEAVKVYLRERIEKMSKKI